jgi:hypothetical protein
MIPLTDKQREILLKLGGPTSFETILSDVWDELISLGLIYKRSDGKFKTSKTSKTRDSHQFFLPHPRIFNSSPPPLHLRPDTLQDLHITVPNY